MKMPELSPELKEILKVWEPFASDALIVLQDEVRDKNGELYIPEKTQAKLQMNIGTGFVIAKCRDANHIDARLNDINIGDRVKFPSGVTISAEFPNTVPEHRRCHILHVMNLVMIDRCGEVVNDSVEGTQES
jgi:hypothetical protein